MASRIHPGMGRSGVAIVFDWTPNKSLHLTAATPCQNGRVNSAAGELGPFSDSYLPSPILKLRPIQGIIHGNR